VNIKAFTQVLASVLVFLFALGWGVYLFVAALLDKLSSVQSELAKALIAASATVLAAVIALVAGKIWEQRLKIRDEIRAKKIPIYEKHIATFFDILYSKQQKKEHEVAFKLFAEKMITWGSSDVIKAWNRFRSMDADGCIEQERVDRLEHLFRAIRKDAGNPVWNLQKGDLLGLFVNKDPKNS
jgi:hypothetical protein